MSKKNGVKQFLYVVIDDERDAFILRSSHDPSMDEVVEALGFGPQGLSVVRIDEGEIIDLPSLPHKQ